MKEVSYIFTIRRSSLLNVFRAWQVQYLLWYRWIYSVSKTHASKL